MTNITFYLDFISPYAYLAFEELPKQLMGISHRVEYRPILFGAVLNHHGHRGPAEIPGKREWTYRQVLWQAKQMGVQLNMPLAHPFNPLSLLRLAIACSEEGAPNRYVCETIFRHVWQGGQAAEDANRFTKLSQSLDPKRDLQDANVKNQLKSNTEQAVAKGVFGVPTFAIDDKLFWGLDALPMVRQYLEKNPLFDDAIWKSVGGIEIGITRKL
ncbi:MAG: 2-hydroxychromene-2-carboxylate isomerase [Burkholderiales bacterium]|nr:2-hydroxychromene-2-carboxylate isomerase [Burkholderiales bacterium]